MEKKEMEKTEHEHRIELLQTLMAEQGVAAVALNAGPGLHHMSGLNFHLMERPVVLLVPQKGRVALVLPELEEAKGASAVFGPNLFLYGEDPRGWSAVFSRALQSIVENGAPGGRIAVEPRQLRLLEYDYLRGAAATLGADCEFVDGSALIGSLRLHKDAQEIAMMRRAVQIAESALEATLPAIRIGVSEQEIAAELVLQLLRGGSDGELPFMPIVAAGPNGANPHAVPGSRKLASGDLLIIDWGARFGGYVSDLTRTFGIGELSEEAKKIHAAVAAANEAGRKAGGPGIPCSAVDQAARQAIEQAGYGPRFNHRTGHGLGLECHEEPYMRGDNEQLLAPGMAYTVEPGIYLPGVNGVRIEDDVVVTESGAESLSTMSRDLRILG